MTFFGVYKTNDSKDFDDADADCGADDADVAGADNG